LERQRREIEGEIEALDATPGRARDHAPSHEALSGLRAILGR
jgi:hypothetical protein